MMLKENYILFLNVQCIMTSEQPVFQLNIQETLTLLVYLFYLLPEMNMLSKNIILYILCLAKIKEECSCLNCNMYCNCCQLLFFSYEHYVCTLLIMLPHIVVPEAGGLNC